MPCGQWICKVMMGEEGLRVFMVNLRHSAKPVISMLEPSFPILSGDG